jgi:hypothetical protein
MKFTISVPRNLIFAIIVFALASTASAQTQPQAQPCPPASPASTSAGGTNNSSSGQKSVSQAAADAKAALKNLGSVFGKKKTPDAANTAPCTPATPGATPGSPSGAAPSDPAAAPPAGSASQPSQSAPTSQDAVPFSPDSGATTGASATAGSAQRFASNAPPDFSKLPDIGGTLRVGLSPDATQQAILKIHPDYKVIPYPNAGHTFAGYSGAYKSPDHLLRASFFSDPLHIFDDFQAFFTMPPTKQQAFAVTRTVPYPGLGIERLKLVAALRQKYGSETTAKHEWDKTKEATGDERISVMYWVYDEQGHLIPPGKDTSTWAQPAFNCVSIADGNRWGDLANQYRLNTLPPAVFCDSVVMLTVHFSAAFQSPYCTSTETQIYDFALLRRDVQIAGEAAKAESQKQQQQQIDQSKQVKPSL